MRFPLAFKHCRFRAVELNCALPRVASKPMPLASLSVVDSEVAIPELATIPPDPTARTIGGLVAELIPPGSALELGVGRALSGVAGAISARGTEISIHSGLISDWAQELVENGNAVRPMACGEGASVVAAVAMGSADFYRWLDGTPSVRLVDSFHAHDPAHLPAINGFVAVNAASEVDCFGQVGAPERAAPTRVVGGLLDFAIAGAYGGGKSIIVLESIDRAGRSRITVNATNVQLQAQLVTYVVTEHGIARMAGRTWRERTREMVAIAHPDHRDELRKTLDRQ